MHIDADTNYLATKPLRSSKPRIWDAWTILLAIAVLLLGAILLVKTGTASSNPSGHSQSAPAHAVPDQMASNLLNMNGLYVNTRPEL